MSEIDKSNEQRVISDEKRMDSDEQRATSNESPSQHSDPSTQSCVPPQSGSSQHSAPGTPSSSLDPQHYPVDPRLLAAMYGMQSEDEIDLLEYWRVIWKRRWLIIGVSFAAAVLAAAYSLTLPNIYRAEVLLAPVSEEGSKGGGISAALGGLGGLASMAGISLPGGGNVEENLAVLKSREFLWKFIGEEKLMPILFADAWDAGKKGWNESDPKEQPSQWDAFRVMHDVLAISSGKETKLITVAVEWTEPETAAAWANKLVDRLNEHLRQQAIERSQANLRYLNEELAHTQVADMRQALFELISQQQKQTMLASTQKEYAFRVLDAAVAPDKKIKPRRSLHVLVTTLITAMLLILGVLALSQISRFKAGHSVSKDNRSFSDNSTVSE